MPEPAPDPAAAPRELILAGHAGALPQGIPWIAFGEAALEAEGSVALGEAIRPERERLRLGFVDWLGSLNAANASRAWWAHTTSSKNLLASPFGNEVFELLGLRLALASSTRPQFGVVGASAAQVEVIERLAAEPGSRLRIRRVGASRGNGGPVLHRVLAQFLRSFLAWAWWFRNAQAPGTAAVHMFTYADAGFRDGNDAFFGPLAALLAGRSPPVACLHHAFVHGAPRKVVPRVRAAAQFRYSPLYAELQPADFAASLRDTFAALAKIGDWPRPALLEGLDFEPLLRDSLRRDIAGGAYLAVLLINHAARRLAGRLKPPVFVYPFENKSLEKMLLLGLREGNPGGTVVGYQHTSVTPRHTTLLFAPGEAARTPLPDRVVTVGEVTRRYLETYGRYPAGLLVEGCALRQSAQPPLERRRIAPGEGARLLFVLSSSPGELIRACRWLLEAGRLAPSLQLGVRPHPEFPLADLPAPLRREVSARARDFSATPLDENLQWADAVAYASSTVALEALMVGRPVVNLELGDALGVDPVLEPLALHWRAISPAALLNAISEMLALGETEFAMRRAAARQFIERYLRPVSEQRLAPLIAEKTGP